MCAAGVGQKAIFSKILVAIDSSDASMDAVDYATSTELCRSDLLVLDFTNHIK